MNVSACLVTRGDVDMQPILDSLPAEWEIIVWDNDEEFREPTCYRVLPHHRDEIDETWPGQNLSVYGRYAAIGYASNELIYVQDDDVIVSDPRAIVDAWQRECNEWYRTEHLYTEGQKPPWPGVVCNMPEEFRPHYSDSGLVGFGAAFHRNAPKRAFDRWADYYENDAIAPASGERGFFHRRADNWFTAFTPRVLVDVPKTDLPYASNDDRMWKQPGHIGERDRMIELARRVRDDG